jgi:hypothetical protein
MARYIKQELPDLRKTGEKKAYYRLKTERKIDFSQFVDIVSTHNSGISRGEALYPMPFSFLYFFERY